MSADPVTAITAEAQTVSDQKKPTFDNEQITFYKHEWQEGYDEFSIDLDVAPVTEAIAKAYVDDIQRKVDIEDGEIKGGGFDFYIIANETLIKAIAPKANHLNAEIKAEILSFTALNFAVRLMPKEDALKAGYDVTKFLIVDCLAAQNNEPIHTTLVFRKPTGEEFSKYAKTNFKPVDASGGNKDIGVRLKNKAQSVYLKEEIAPLWKMCFEGTDPIFVKAEGYAASFNHLHVFKAFRDVVMSREVTKMGK